jgi:hypothetical protein
MMQAMPRLLQRLAFLFPFFLSAVMGVHDSLNMILPPGGQVCFYEEFVKGANPREVEIFIPQNGNVDIVLKVYGPLTLEEVQQVMIWHTDNMLHIAYSTELHMLLFEYMCT